MWLFFAILFCVITSVAGSFYFAFISVFPLENGNATTNVINAATNVVNSTITKSSA